MRPTVGASGAVYGVLLAFGMLFPNTPLYIMFIPIPIKAKWLVIGFGGLELFLGITNSGGNIAHFAHLCGQVLRIISATASLTAATVPAARVVPHGRHN